MACRGGKKGGVNYKQKRVKFPSLLFIRSIGEQIGVDDYD